MRHLFVPSDMSFLSFLILARISDHLYRSSRYTYARQGAGRYEMIRSTYDFVRHFPWEVNAGCRYQDFSQLSRRLGGHESRLCLERIQPSHEIRASQSCDNNKISLTAWRLSLPAKSNKTLTLILPEITKTCLEPSQECQVDSDFCRRNDSRWVQVHFIPIHFNRSWKSSSRNEYHHTPHALLGVASLRFVVVRDFSWGRKSKVPESGRSRAAICVFVSVAAQAWSCLRLRFRVLHLASRALCWNQLLLASNLRLAFAFEST
jgi:hypothetical protein